MDKEGNLFAKARFLFACINVALGTIDLKHKIYFITSNNMTHIVINISLYSSYNVYLYLINTENIIKKKKQTYICIVLYYIYPQLMKENYWEADWTGSVWKKRYSKTGPQPQG